MDDIGTKISVIVGSIIGLAVLAVVVSARANTTNVIGAFFGGVSNLIGVAISPVTGQSVSAGTGLQGGPWQAGGAGGTSGFAVNLGGGGGGTDFLGGLFGSLTAGSNLPGTGNDPTGGLFGSGASSVGSLFSAGGGSSFIDSGSFF